MSNVPVLNLGQPPAPPSVTVPEVVVVPGVVVVLVVMVLGAVVPCPVAGEGVEPAVVVSGWQEEASTGIRVNPLMAWVVITEGF